MSGRAGSVSILIKKKPGRSEDCRAGELCSTRDTHTKIDRSCYTSSAMYCTMGRIMPRCDDLLCSCRTSFQKHAKQRMALKMPHADKKKRSMGRIVGNVMNTFKPSPRQVIPHWLTDNTVRDFLSTCIQQCQVNSTSLANTSLSYGAVRESCLLEF